MANSYRAACVDYIGAYRYSPSTMYLLLVNIEMPGCADVWRTVFYTLYSTANAGFYDLLEQSSAPVLRLAPLPDGDIYLFGERYGMAQAA